MATSIISFTNEFSDGTKASLNVGPVDTSAVSVQTIKSRVRSVNNDLANSDTSVYGAYMAGKYGGNWSRISEVKITTTNRIYLT